MAKSISNIRAFILLLAILTVVVLADVAAVWYYKSHVSQFLSQQPEPAKIDAGVVFFGDYTNDGAALGPDSKKRAAAAVQLYKNNTIKKVICVGGYDYSKWKGKPHLMRQYLLQHGVAPGDILYDSASFNTITNWAEAKKIVIREKFNSIVAISAPLHLYRIAHMIEDTSVFYKPYHDELTGFGSYWQLYLDVHHEWASLFLSFALRDEARNRLVYIVRTIWDEFNDLI